jgi:DNA anti-recombination protein RmuC
LKDIPKSITDEISKIKNYDISSIQQLCSELKIECQTIETFDLTANYLADSANKLSEAIGGYMSDLNSLIKNTQNFVNNISKIRESNHFKIIKDNLEALLQEINRIKNELEAKLGEIAKEIKDKANRVEQLNKVLKYLSEIDT